MRSLLRRSLGDRKPKKQDPNPAPGVKFIRNDLPFTFPSELPGDGHSRDESPSASPKDLRFSSASARPAAAAHRPAVRLCATQSFETWPVCLLGWLAVGRAEGSGGGSRTGKEENGEEEEEGGGVTAGGT